MVTDLKNRSALPGTSPGGRRCNVGLGRHGFPRSGVLRVGGGLAQPYPARVRLAIKLRMQIVALLGRRL